MCRNRPLRYVFGGITQWKFSSNLIGAGVKIDLL
jgi:hypothetical protein